VQAAGNFHHLVSFWGIVKNTQFDSQKQQPLCAISKSSKMKGLYSKLQVIKTNNL
jgi:hypothetical protein